LTDEAAGSTPFIARPAGPQNGPTTSPPAPSNTARNARRPRDVQGLRPRADAGTRTPDPLLTISDVWFGWKWLVCSVFLAGALAFGSAGYP
jgi:hypothetical protein